MRPMGVHQEGMVRALRQHGSWIDNRQAAGVTGSVWYWTSYSVTLRLLNSLVGRGLVVVAVENGCDVYRLLNPEVP